MATRKRKSDQKDEPKEAPEQPQAEAPAEPPAEEQPTKVEVPKPAEEEKPPAPEPAPVVTEDQMLRIKRASTKELEDLLTPGFPEHVAVAVRSELQVRRAKAKKSAPSEMLRVKKAKMRRTRDGFFTEVKEGSTFPLSEEVQLRAEGFDLERVKVVVVEDEMGNPRMRLA
jgi:hypothetical protein